MHFVSVVFKHHNMSLQLVFDSFKEAKVIYDRINLNPMESNIEVSDKYGQQASFSKEDVMVYVITDNELMHKAAEEKAISQARAQSMLNRRASADSVINNQLVTPKGLQIN